jgi:N-hydroxyarylamine O-acetyltransferase
MVAPPSWRQAPAGLCGSGFFSDEPTVRGARHLCYNMGAVPLDSNLVQRYLGLLGLSPKVPSLAALSDIVAAHLWRIPFENISKLYYRRSLGFTGVPGIGMFLDGIEQYRFGGTCYANNFHLYSLLAELGYDVKLCSADMSNPDVHMVIMVAVDGREYLVDVGYGAPFLEPMPRDLPSEYVVEFGADRYVLRPQDAIGRSRLDLYRDGTFKHGYLAKPGPRRHQDFSPAVAHSFRPEATFLNTILLARFSAARSVIIHGLTLLEFSGKQAVSRAALDRQQLPGAIETHFGVPADLSQKALAELDCLGDAWG